MWLIRDSVQQVNRSRMCQLYNDQEHVFWFHNRFSPPVCSLVFLCVWNGSRATTLNSEMIQARIPSKCSSFGTLTGIRQKKKKKFHDQVAWVFCRLSRTFVYPTLFRVCSILVCTVNLSQEISWTVLNAKPFFPQIIAWDQYLLEQMLGHGCLCFFSVLENVRLSGCP